MNYIQIFLAAVFTMLIIVGVASIFLDDEPGDY